MAVSEPVDHAEDFERYRHEVYAWAFRLLGRHHDALDVAQDVFLRWLHQARRAMPDQPRSWLRTVTINRAIDLVRSRRGLAQADAATPAPADGPSSPETEELRTAIADAMLVLTDMQRGVLIAHVYDGLTFAQIAAEQGLAVPTIKTHYLRALRVTRDRLARNWRPEGADR